MSLINKPTGSTKKPKRLGRGPGSGVGGTAGKGLNGQNSRSGGGVRPGFEGGQMPLFRRIARRGFSNYPFKTEAVAINVAELETKYEAGETVSYETLIAKKIIRPSDSFVKILAKGELTKALTVELLAVSAGAAEKIKAAGGKITTGVEENNG